MFSIITGAVGLPSELVGTAAIFLTTPIPSITLPIDLIYHLARVVIGIGHPSVNLMWPGGPTSSVQWMEILSIVVGLPPFLFANEVYLKLPQK